jgi:hypothetical protein
MDELVRRMVMFHYPAHPGWAGGITWQYQKPDREPTRAVVDVTDALPACAVCGAAGYFQAFPDGLMVVRWHCGHEPAEDEERDD